MSLSGDTRLKGRGGGIAVILTCLDCKDGMMNVRIVIF